MSTDDGSAAHAGVFAEITDMPDVGIDDEQGTSVSVRVNLTHMGGPAAETIEVVSASLGLDLEPYADIELAVPADFPPFEGLADGDTHELVLRGSIPDNHDDWGLCGDPQQEAADAQRVTLDLVLLVKPGANDDEDELVFESQAVQMNCTFTG
ncbi:hypothetical protein DB30_00879 [Enhygromyxa salina]|uniref:Uncharacterized protein n=2 Tax=Enhygromyxa salina TaxID=215803 RepID=A0A0C1ZPH7_9BACT|nr:hypothetical protein DB30_00879 [Enhygromyxa salina]